MLSECHDSRCAVFAVGVCLCGDVCRWCCEVRTVCCSFVYEMTDDSDDYGAGWLCLVAWFG